MAKRKKETKRNWDDEELLVRQGVRIITRPVAEEAGGGHITFDALAEFSDDVYRPKELRFERKGRYRYASRGGGRWEIRRISKNKSMHRAPGAWLLRDRESGLVTVGAGFRELRDLANRMHLYTGAGPWIFVDRAILMAHDQTRRYAWVVMDSRTGCWRHYPGEHMERYAKAQVRTYTAERPMIGECPCEVCKGWGEIGGRPTPVRVKRLRDSSGRFVSKDGARKKKIVDHGFRQKRVIKADAE